MTSFDALSEQWINHLGKASVKFPRGMLYQSTRDASQMVRPIVNSPTDYANFIYDNIHRSDIYTGLYSDHSILHDIYDKLYVDIDNDDLRKSYDDSRRLSESLETECGVEPLTYASGSKGYALYVFFPESKVDIYAIRRFVLDVAAQAGVEVDTHVLGDPRRVSRLPYTYNFKTVGKGPQPRSCIPVDLSWGFDAVLRESINPEYFLPVTNPTSNALKKALKEISERLPKTRPTQAPMDIGDASELVKHLFGVAEGYQDGRHRTITFLLTPALISMGLDDVEIMTMCQDWIERTGKNFMDYRNHVRSSIRRNRVGPNRDGGEPWSPWTIEKFLMRNPKLLDNFATGDIDASE